MTTAAASIPQPAPRAPREIHVELTARETAWEIAKDRFVSAWGYQGSVPGPTIAFRPDDRPGQWMYHCHILEHHAAGMMGHFEVVR